MAGPVITDLTAEYVQVPLRNPFVLSIRTALEANIIRWRLITSAGEYAGECVPVQYVTGETPVSALAIAPHLREILIGQEVKDQDSLIRTLRSKYPADIAAVAGVEIALYNAYADFAGRSVFQLLGGKQRSILSDLTIARNPNAIDIVRAAWADGFRIFKMKVGGADPESDLVRLLQVRDEFPDALIRLDANQAFTSTDALKLIDSLLAHDVNLELIEQPVPKEDLVALAEVAKQSPIPVIADEACKSAEDARRIFETPVHGVNVKLMKSGIRGALEIIDIAKEAGRKLMVGCMLESQVGMAASVALACGTGAFDYVDLDGHLLLELGEPITAFRSKGPEIEVLGTD